MGDTEEGSPSWRPGQLGFEELRWGAVAGVGRVFGVGEEVEKRVPPRLWPVRMVEGTRGGRSQRCPGAAGSTSDPPVRRGPDGAPSGAGWSPTVLPPAPCPLGLEGPATQSFEHAHAAGVVHLGPEALAGATAPGPHQSPLNGDCGLG